MFIHPFLLAIGLAAASIPVIVHFLTRPQPIRMRLSTIRLVSDALHQRRSRDRLRDFLVLLFRSLAVAMLAIAIARPLLFGDTRQSDETVADRVKVVLLDASGSMAAIDGSTTRFDKARTAAVTELQYRTGLAANLMIASHHPGAVFDSPSANLALLRDRLADATVSAAAIDVNQTLAEAARQLADSKPETRRELTIISDFQRASWARADFRVLPEDTDVRLIEMGGGETLPNIAIEQVRMSSAPTAGKQVSVLVEVANHSPDTRNVKCQLELTEVSGAAEAIIEPFSTATMAIPVDWPESGWQSGRVRLIDTGDAIPADDSYPLVIGVRSSQRQVIVTESRGRPGDGAFFISQVLWDGSDPTGERGEPEGRGDPAVESRVVSVTPAMLDTPPAQTAEIWIVTDVETLDDSAIKRIALWLRRGKSVFYLAKGPVDANNLQALQESLGGDMQPPVQLIASLDSAKRSDLRIEQMDLQNRPFRVLGEEVSATVANWRFGGGLPTRNLDSSSIDAVAATLSDQSALLYFTDVGAGRLAVLNADLSRSSFAYQAAFVPLIAETMDRLTDVGGGVVATASGQPIVRELPGDAPAAESLRVVRDDSIGLKESNVLKESIVFGVEEFDAGTIRSQDGRLIWNWAAADRPAVYWVVDQAGKPIWGEAVRCDPSQQDLRILTADVLQSRLAGERQLKFVSSVVTGQNDSLWVWAMLGLLGCVVSELVTLLWFRS